MWGWGGTGGRGVRGAESGNREKSAGVTCRSMRSRIEEVGPAVLKALRAGAGVQAAASAGGVAEDTVRTWVKTGVLEKRDYDDSDRREGVKGLFLNPKKRPT